MRVLRFLGAVLLVSVQGYALQSNTPEAASAQPDNAALVQKIRDLEDRMIALEGQIRQMKTQQTPPAEPATAAVSNAESGTQPASPTLQRFRRRYRLHSVQLGERTRHV